MAYQGIARPVRICRHGSCWRRTRRLSGYCELCQKREWTRSDRSRPSAAARGYGPEWRRFRIEYLKRHPYCVRCRVDARRTVATVVDHIQDHRGDRALFWAVSNLQSLCRRCHNTKTGREIQRRKGGA